MGIFLLIHLLASVSIVFYYFYSNENVNKNTDGFDATIIFGGGFLILIPFIGLYLEESIIVILGVYLCCKTLIWIRNYIENRISH